MSQTNVMVGCAIVAFIIFITVKGELPSYLGFFLGNEASQPVAPQQTNSSNSSGVNVGAIANTAAALAG